MEQLIDFIGKEPLLVSATVIVIIAIIVVELRHRLSGIVSLEPQAATQLYNRQDALFIDTRAEADYRKAHLPGAVHVPADAVADRAGKLERHKDKPIIVYCATGQSSGRVAGQLKKLGFNQVSVLKGGFGAWQGNGYPLEGK